MEFLTTHKAEVIDVVLTEFNQEIYEEDLKAEGKQEVYNWTDRKVLIKSL